MARDNLDAKDEELERAKLRFERQRRAPLVNLAKSKTRRGRKRFWSFVSRKSKKAGDKLFNTWMFEESDLVQAAAKAYGERMVLEQALAAIEEVDDSLQPILKPLASLYAIHCIEKDLGSSVAGSCEQANNDETF